MALKRNVILAVAAAMLAPMAAYSAAQIGVQGSSGAVNLTKVAPSVVAYNAGVVKGTATYMGEIAAATTTFIDTNLVTAAPAYTPAGALALDLQTLTGAGVTVNNQANFRFDVKGGTLGVTSTANDIQITLLGSGVIVTSANVDTAINTAITGLGGINALRLAAVPAVAIVTAAEITAIQNAATTNSAASATAATAVAVIAPLTVAEKATLTGVITGVATVTDQVINNQSAAGAFTILQGGAKNTPTVIFQLDITGITGWDFPASQYNSGLATAGALINIKQSDLVDIFVNGINATAPAAGGFIRVDYEYHMFAGGNGSASAINNQRTNALSASTAIAINTAPAFTTTLTPNPKAALIDVAQASKKFVATTRQILQGESGLQIGSLGGATVSGAGVAGSLSAAALSNNSNVLGLNTGAAPSVLGGQGAMYGGVTNAVANTVGGSWNAAVVGEIKSQVVPGSPSIGSINLVYANGLNAAGVVYNQALATFNVDTITLTVTSKDPAGFAAMAAKTKGKVFLDVNKDGVFNAGDLAATTVTAKVATFTNVAIATIAANPNVVLTEDGTIVIAPTTFSASAQYNFAKAPATYTNPAAVTSAFGSDVKNGSTRVADVIPASNNASKKGFVRVVNRSAQAGNVYVTVYNDAGKMIVKNKLLVANLAPNATFTMGKGLAGGAGEAIDVLAAAVPGTPSFVGRARAVITGEFPQMDVTSTVGSTGVIQTNMSAHAGQ